MLCNAGACAHFCPRKVLIDEVEQEWGGGLRCLTHRMRDNGNPGQAWRGEWSGPIQEPSVGRGTESHLAAPLSEKSLIKPVEQEKKEAL